MKKILAIIVVILLCSFAKENSNNAIVGKYAAGDSRMTIVLKKNGTFRMNVHIELTVGEPGKWEMKGDTVFLDFRDETFTDCKYRWNGKDSLCSMDGIAHFTRVKK